jgi:hypothetical protein
MLREELAQFARENKIPRWIKYELKEGNFTEHVNTLLDKLEGSGVALPPSFAFIDPHGYRVPLKEISRLLKFPRCECLINFMYKFINRATHRTEPQVQTYLDDLFGTPDWRGVRSLTAPERREEFLVELYKKQLQEHVGLPYVRTFQMIDSGNRTEYFLFFGTRSPKGLSQMKKAMWKADPEGGQVFSDRTNLDSGQMVLIQPTANVSPLKRLLQQRFRDRGWIDIGDVEKFVLFDTAYSEQLHLKTVTLKPMELDKIVDVDRPKGSQKRGSQKRPGAYPPLTKIRFN